MSAELKIILTDENPPEEAPLRGVPVEQVEAARTDVAARPGPTQQGTKDRVEEIPQPAPTKSKPTEDKESIEQLKKGGEAILSLVGGEQLVGSLKSVVETGRTIGRAIEAGAKFLEGPSASKKDQETGVPESTRNDALAALEERWSPSVLAQALADALSSQNVGVEQPQPSPPAQITQPQRDVEPSPPSQSPPTKPITSDLGSVGVTKTQIPSEVSAPKPSATTVPTGPLPASAPSVSGSAAAGAGANVASASEAALASSARAAGTALAGVASEGVASVGALAGVAAAAGPVGIAMAATAAVVVGVGVALKEFGDSVQRATDQLAPYSAELALAQSQSQLRRELTNIDRARRDGAQLARVQGAKDRVEEALEKLGYTIWQPLLAIADRMLPLVELVTQEIEITNASISLLKESVEAGVAVATEAITLGAVDMNSTKELLDVGSASAQLVNAFQKVVEDQNGNMRDPLENDLFGGFEPLKPRDGRPMAPVAPFGGNF